MAKLKCDDHNRRVLTIGKKFVHRTGDRTPCDSYFATIGVKTFVADEQTALRVYEAAAKGSPS